MQRIKINYLLIGLLVYWFIGFLSPPPVFAQPQAWTLDQCYKNVTLKDGTVVNGVATIQGLECVFSNIARIIVPIAGLALFIMLIIGSLGLLMSAGEPKAVQKAQKTITSAIIGIVVVLCVWFILKLIQTITGVDVTKFAIPK